MVDEDLKRLLDSLREENRFFNGFASGENVENMSKNYTARIVAVASQDPNNLHFRSVRIFYRLPVSPARGVARFDDVPITHPFYRFIEALATSGITAGCSTNPPQYCPDAPLTRGQMAVFLAAALGLHWPN